MDHRAFVPRRYGHWKAFTLIELLVVVAIIALLMSILLPSLKSARDQAKSVKCGVNLRSIGQSMSTYTSESQGGYPSSYLYPSDAAGSYDVRNQPLGRPYGYMHWSWFLYGNGKISDSAFRCPAVRTPGGGAPRTNPGPNAVNWEAGQVDDHGQSVATTSSIEDKQASHMAYTANAAIIPRNKFTSALVSQDTPGGPRVNVYVNDTIIKKPSGTILMTEFLDQWKMIGVDAGNGVLSKSHRPLHPFYNNNSAFSPYGLPQEVGNFFYGKFDDPAFGLLPLRQLEDAGAIDLPTYNRANFVGRHHPGGSKNTAWGGTANYVYCDGHVERKTVYKTLKLREWGDRFYSVTGKNNVVMHAGVYTQNGNGDWPE